MTSPKPSRSVPRVGIVMSLGEQRGGAEFALVQYLAGIEPSQRRYVHVCFLETGPLVDQTIAAGFPVAVIPAGRLRQPGRWLGSILKLRRWIRAHRLRSVLSWMPKAHLYAGPAGLLAQVPVLWWQHGMPAGGLTDRLLAAIPARRVLACSRATATAQLKVSGPRAQVRIIYPPADVAALRTTPGGGRRKLNLPENALVIGIVARLQHWKGVHVVIDAFAAVASELPELCLVVVGGRHALESGYADRVEAQAHRLGLAGRVRFCGHQSNVPEWMSIMDIVVHASFGEPFGMVIVEAMAMGKPVIATAVGGPTEIVMSGVNGLLVPPGDVDRLAEALRELIRSPERRRALGRAAAGSVERFATPRFVAEVTASMREVIA